ncbi:MAG: hypothetical protein QOH23_1590 [Gaiellaceae bacterium]|nr:hypothetical protein [Gaiellaceae bacterium]
MYAELCRRYARDPVARELVELQSGRRPVLALLGGLHYLVLAGEAAWDDPLEQHADFLADFVQRQGVQTNEVQRLWVLLPLFLHATIGAEAVDVVELGASGGLNLMFDRYGYRYEQAEWGARNATLMLSGTERTPLPASLLGQDFPVRSRVGIDRAPVDVRTEEGARLLESFVWAGQTERAANLRAAIDVVRDDPPEIVRGDITEALPDLLAALPDNGLTLVFQSSVFEYVDEAGRARVREALDTSGRDLVFISAGQPRAEVRSWGMRIYRPGREREFVGHADYHGTWLEYW